MNVTCSVLINSSPSTYIEDAIMSSGAQRPRKEQVLSKVLVEGFPDAGTFENMPKVRKIGPETHLPYVF